MADNVESANMFDASLTTHDSRGRISMIRKRDAALRMAAYARGRADERARELSAEDVEKTAIIRQAEIDVAVDAARADERARTIEIIDAERKRCISLEFRNGENVCDRIIRALATERDEAGVINAGKNEAEQER